MSTGVPGGNLEKTVEKLKELVEKLLGQRGNDLDKAITVRDLVQSGLVQYKRADGTVYSVSQATGQVRSLNEGAAYTATPPIVNDLTATGSLGIIHLSWTGVNYPFLLRYNIYRADVDDFGQALKINSTITNVYADELGNGTGANGKYYWIRAESQSGREGPLSSTKGTYGETSYDPSYVISLLTKKWEASYDYAIDDVVIPNPAKETGLWYKVTTDGGSSDTDEPIWPTSVSGTVVDGGITWTAIAAPTELVPFVVGEVGGSPAVIMNTVFIGDATITNAKIGSVAADKVTTGSLVATVDVTTGAIKGGQTDFDTGSGFFLGKSSGDFKFSIGNSGGNKIVWDGTNLTITGSVTVTSGSIDFANVTGATKPADNADVTASNTALNSAKVQPTTANGGTPPAAGLHMFSDYMGYSDGTTWNAYIKSDGSFHFGDQDSKYIAFSGGDVSLGRDTKLLGADAYNNNAIYWHTYYDSLDGFNTYTNGGGSSVVVDGGLELTCGTNTSDEARAQRDIGTYALTETSFAKNSRFKTKIRGFTGTYYELFIGVGALTNHHYGFSARPGVNGNIWAECMQATLNTKTDTGVSWASASSHKLEAVFTTGTDVKFYVDDVLKATITTNLPAASNPYPLSFYIKNYDGTGGAFTMLSSEYKYQQDE